MPAKNLRFERIRKKEDMLRRKQSQRELRKLMSIRGYWTKESNIRHQNLIDNPLIVVKDTPNLKIYEIKNRKSKNIEKFIIDNRNRILNLMEINTKVQFNLQVTLEKEAENGKSKEATWFLIKPFVDIIRTKDMKKSINSLIEFFNMKLSELETRESGWRLKSIDKLIIKIVPYSHGTGGCLKAGKLPKKLENREIFPIIKNEDEECLKWAIIYSFIGGNNGKITEEHKKKAEEFNWNEISYPSGKSDLKKFEKNNPEYLIYCYGYIGGEFYIHYSNNNYRDLEKSRKTINLLLFNNHYFPIMNLRSFYTILYGSRRKYFSCKNCMSNFSSKKDLEDHHEYCKKEYKTKTELPNKGETLKFKNFKFTEKIPYICYIDSEAILEPVEIKNGKTTKYQKHNASCFGLLFVNSIEKKTEYFHLLSADELIKKLMEYGKLYDKDPIPLSKEERLKGEKRFEEIDNCEECGKFLNGKGVLDHCHFSGKFRKILCSPCNLRKTAPKILPVVGHNCMKYDTKLFIRALKRPKTKILAKNIENFISISLLQDNIRFIDSFKFLNRSLSDLVNNLLDKGEESFHYTHEYFPEDEKFKLCLKKGVFPYSYITSKEVLKETSLPPREKFYNNLKGEHISEEEYEHAKKVWKIFECKTIDDYLKIYQKLDCTQLADIFEQFRENILEIYDLDPTHYITLPSLSFDCLLKYSGEELDLITDPTMYNFLEKGIRGGVSMCVKRFAQSNNRYQKDYDPDTESSFIVYLDANNLYGYAMSQNLPVSDFEWGDPEKWEEYEDCIVDVDISLPEKYWDYLSDFPLFPQRENNKLLCTFAPKKNYICHSKYLINALKYGYQIEKVNKVLTFKSKPWIKSYIEKNTELRTKATSDFEKDLWKLMNNSVYGKQIENVRNRINIKYCTNKNVRNEYRKQTFKDVIDLSDNVFLIEHAVEKIELNKPIAGGLVILDHSKILMNDFFYDYLKPKFEDNCKLIYTDTDSFVLQIYCEDFYKEISEDVENYFDTSNYPNKTCLDGSVFPSGKNKKVLGKFKDELGGKQIKRFIGLRSKLYTYENEDGKIGKRCKGITHKILKNITFDDFFDSLNGEIKYGEMDIFRSHKHTIFTEKIEKKVLDPFDEKRQILEDGIHTYPWC